MNLKLPSLPVFLSFEVIAAQLNDRMISKQLISIVDFDARKMKMKMKMKLELGWMIGLIMMMKGEVER